MAIVALILILLLVPMLLRDTATLVRLLAWTVKVLVLAPFAIARFLSTRSDRQT